MFAVAVCEATLDINGNMQVLNFYVGSMSHVYSYINIKHFSSSLTLVVQVPLNGLLVWKHIIDGT